MTRECQHLVTQVDGTYVDCGQHADLDPQVVEGPPAMTLALGAIADEFGKQARQALEATGPRVMRAFHVVSDEFAKRQSEDFGDDR